MGRVPKAERTRRVAEALELVRLPHVERRKPAALSGGQQQRVALARALVNRPAVLLLDEPLGALDLKLRQAMQSELKRLNREVGATVVYVTHDQEEALAMSDRIVVMNDGRILQHGPPQEVYERPRNRFVADFIGRTNFLSGRLRRVEGGTAEVEIPQSGVVRAAVAADVVPNREVTIAVRPEKVVFAADAMPDGPDRPWNALDGAIAEIVYLGTHTQYLVRLPSGATVIVHRQNRDEGEHAYRIAEQVRLCFAPASASVLID